MSTSNNLSEGGQNSKKFFKLPSWFGSKRVVQNPIIPSMADSMPSMAVSSQQFFNGVSANTPQVPTALHKVNNLSVASNVKPNPETHSYTLDSVGGNGASVTGGGGNPTTVAAPVVHTTDGVYHQPVSTTAGNRGVTPVMPNIDYTTQRAGERGDSLSNDSTIPTHVSVEKLKSLGWQQGKTLDGKAGLEVDFSKGTSHITLNSSGSAIYQNLDGNTTNSNHYSEHLTITNPQTAFGNTSPTGEPSAEAVHTYRMGEISNPPKVTGIAPLTTSADFATQRAGERGDPPLVNTGGGSTGSTTSTGAPTIDNSVDYSNKGPKPGSPEAITAAANLKASTDYQALYSPDKVATDYQVNPGVTGGGISPINANEVAHQTRMDAEESQSGGVASITTTPTSVTPSQSLVQRNIAAKLARMEGADSQGDGSAVLTGASANTSAGGSASLVTTTKAPDPAPVDGGPYAALGDQPMVPNITPAPVTAPEVHINDGVYHYSTQTPTGSAGATVPLTQSNPSITYSADDKQSNGYGGGILLPKTDPSIMPPPAISSNPAADRSISRLE